MKKIKRPRFIAFLCASAIWLPGVAFGQAAPAAASAKSVYTAPQADLDKIKDEGMNRSQVMNHLSYLTDVIGPRLTNSPGMKRANEWTRDLMTKWGMSNAKLEPFGPWGRGWSLNSFTAQVVSPTHFPVIAFPNAWSLSTKGPVTSEVVYLDIKTDDDYAKYKGRLRAKIVLIGQPRELKADFAGMGDRYSDEQLAKMADAPDPATVTAEPLIGSDGKPSPKMLEMLRGLQRQFKDYQFVFEEGAAILVENSTRGSGGTLMVHSAIVIPSVRQPGQPAQPPIQAWSKEAEQHMVPHVTMATEDFNRLARMVRQGVTPTVTMDIQGQYYDGDLMAYNTVAEIPGTDPKLKDEIVMLGGHLDSWHASTGATDNAAGCAVAMEAVRILIASGLKPRRTIRIALWSGEEQGLNGSKGYVQQQFGELKNIPADPKAQPPRLTTTALIKGANYEKLSVYYNLDNGTGKIRGVYLQGNSAAKPIFQEWLKPFNDLGARTLTLSNTGGTDHLAFDQIGLPGFGFIQDPIEYESRTHHTNQDNFDRIQADDLKQAATIMAAFVYQSAMSEARMPRKARK